MADLNKYGTAADVNRYISELEAKLALYEQARPADPILYAVSKTDGSFLAVNKENYDTLARAHAALKVEHAPLYEHVKDCDALNRRQAEEIAELKAKLAACEKDWKDTLNRVCKLINDPAGAKIAYATELIDAELKENKI